jgi:hypothetical protein
MPSPEREEMRRLVSQLLDEPGKVWRVSAYCKGDASANVGKNKKALEVYVDGDSDIIGKVNKIW